MKDEWWVVVWLLVGVAITGMVGRLRPDWYQPGEDEPGHGIKVLVSVVVWPVPFTVFMASALMGEPRCEK